MAFENKGENKRRFSIEELEAEKDGIIADITRLGGKMDEANRELQNLSDSILEKQGVLESISSEVGRIGALLESKTEELVLLEKQISSAVEKVQYGIQLDADNLAKHDQLVRVSDEVFALEKSRESLNKQLDGLTEEVKRITLQLDADQKAYDSVILEKKSIIDQANKKIDSLNVVIGDLESLVGRLTGEANVQRDASEIHQKVLKQTQEEVALLKNEFASLKESIANVAAAAEIESKNRFKEVEEKELAMQKREGDVSLKERLLGEKHKSLIAIKNEMELHLGRKIPINIPSEDVF